jgi:hypothetical protein
MRNILFILALLFTFNFASAQAEKKANKVVAEKFDKLYNKGAYDSIYAMYSPDMKKMISIEENRAFLQGVKDKNGNIKKREFKKYLRTYAFYKAIFEKSVISLKISIDDRSMINGLLVNPYGDN